MPAKKQRVTATSVRPPTETWSANDQKQALNRRDRRFQRRQVPEPGTIDRPRSYREADRAHPRSGLANLSDATSRPIDSFGMHEAMVRALVAKGSPLDHARTLADIAAAMNKSAKPGPEPAGPRLYVRENKRIYIVYGSGADRQRFSTGATVREGEDFRTHPQAVASLAAFIEGKVQEVLGRLQLQGATMADVFREFLNDHEPNEYATDEAWDIYFEKKAICAQLDEFFGETLYFDLKVDGGLKYVTFRTSQQIKSQTKDIDDEDRVRRTSLVTAAGHVKQLQQVLTYFASKHTQPNKKLKKPKVPKHETLWLSADEWMRLFLASRGWKFDESGRWIDYDRSLRSRYEPVLRLIILYTFGGTRHGNAYELLWAQDWFRGHLDPERGEIKGQGLLSAVSSKGRGTSELIGSLKHLAVGWRDRDAEKRGDSKTRFTHVLHKRDGSAYLSPMRLLFDEVRRRSGLFHVTPHILKHTGVTFCTAAGMTQRQVSLAFSTTMKTLEDTYTHLHTEWNKVDRQFDDRSLFLLNLRRLTAPSAAKYYGGNVPLKVSKSRGSRSRLPLAAPMTAKARKIYSTQSDQA